MLGDVAVGHPAAGVRDVEQHLGDSAASGAEEFAFGLDLLLDGLERLRDEP